MYDDGEYCTYSEDCSSEWCSNDICCDYGYSCCDDDTDCELNYVCDTTYSYCVYDYSAYDYSTSGCDSSSCYESDLGDGYCDSACNNYACNYDSGDCGGLSNGESCSDSETCSTGWCDSGICCGYGSTCCYSDSDCLTTDYVCSDYSCVYTLSDGYCAEGCPTSYLADGACDVACNVFDCNYDNGDCGGSYLAPEEGESYNLDNLEVLRALLEENLKQKVKSTNIIELAVSMSPYPLPNEMVLHLDEELKFYLTIQNRGNIPTNIVFYSVETEEPFSTSPAVLSEGTSKETLVSVDYGKELGPNKILESDSFVIHGDHGGSTNLIVNIYYIYEGSGTYESLTVPITVYDSHINKHEIASDLYGGEMLDLEEMLSYLEVQTSTGTIGLNNVEFVSPVDMGSFTQEWNLYASYISYYKEKLVDDVVGSSSEVIDFMGDIQDIAAEETLQGTQDAGLRAVAPAAAKIGWDLGRFTKSVEKIKEEDERISNLFNADIGWAQINDQKTRVMYKERNGVYYVVKVGVL